MITDNPSLIACTEVIEVSKPVHYFDVGEVASPQEIAPLLGTSDKTLKTWAREGRCPMGEIVEGEHYYRVGPNYLFIKDRMCELFGILPKTVVYVEKRA